jgi:hypothetical protein
MDNKEPQTLNEPFGGVWTEELPRFGVLLDGPGSSVVMDGKTLAGVRDVSVRQSIDGLPIVTIEFLAQSVSGLPE